MRAVLQAILNLEQVDRQILRVQAELARLPAERAARRAEIDRKLARRDTQRQELLGLKVRVKEIEDHSSAQRQRLRKVENEASSTRQDMALLAAFQHQIRTLKREISEAEEEGLGLVERSEALEAGLGTLATEIAQDEAVYAEYAANVERESAAARSRLEELRAERARREDSEIPAEALSLYSRLLVHREGSATAELDGRICQACYMEIPTNLCVRVTRGTELVQCPSCDRILHQRE